jgi:hypothetical protein
VNTAAGGRVEPDEIHPSDLQEVPMRASMRTLVLMAAVVLAVASFAHAQANFAGTWVLDRSQSQLPQFHKGGAAPGAQGGTPPDITLTVDQSGDQLKATRTMKRGNRENAFSETYTVNGSEQTFTGRGNRTVVTKAAWDGPRLVVNSNTTRPSRSGGDVQVSRESVWTVSPDGNTLTIQTTFHSPRGERTFTRVYHRA